MGAIDFNEFLNLPKAQNHRLGAINLSLIFATISGIILGIIFSSNIEKIRKILNSYLIDKKFKFLFDMYTNDPKKLPVYGLEPFCEIVLGRVRSRSRVDSLEHQGIRLSVRKTARVD